MDFATFRDAATLPGTVLDNLPNLTPARIRAANVIPFDGIPSIDDAIFVWKAIAEGWSTSFQMSKTKLNRIEKRNNKIRLVAQGHLRLLDSTKQMLQEGPLQVRGHWVFVSECHGSDCDNKGSPDCADLFCGRCASRFHLYRELLETAARFEGWSEDEMYGFLLPPIPAPTAGNLERGLWPMHHYEDDGYPSGNEDEEAAAPVPAAVSAAVPAAVSAAVPAESKLKLTVAHQQFVATAKESMRGFDADSDSESDIDPDRDTAPDVKPMVTAMSELGLEGRK